MGVPVMFRPAALLLLLAGSSQALNCAECINEMHGLSFMVKQGAPDMMAFLTENYCPSLTRHYVGMLWMVVEHFFVDGAPHICQAWGFCGVAQDSFPYTCEECIEGLEVVGAYMTDPLWIA